MKKLIFIYFILLSPAAWSIEDAGLDEELQQRQIEENINKIGQEINKNIEDAGKNLRMAIPAMTNNLSNIINTFTSQMIPIMRALEENSKLIQASDSMADALKQSLPAQYRQEIKYNIDSKNNELKINGKISEKGTTTRFGITRNLAAATVAQSLITEADKTEDANFHNPDSAKLPNKNILDLDNNKIPFNQFKLELINDNVFLITEDKAQQKSFIFGNLNPVLTIQAESKGPEHAEKIRDFIKNLNLPKINQAVSYQPENDEPDLNLLLPSPEN